MSSRRGKALIRSAHPSGYHSGSLTPLRSGSLDITGNFVGFHLHREISNLSEKVFLFGFVFGLCITGMGA